MKLKYHSGIEGAPAAIGPYSQAVEGGQLVFLSGQIPLPPAGGELPQGIEAQTEQVMANIGAVLRGLGLSFNNVAKTTIFLSDLGNFQTVNQIYERHLNGVKPARSTVQVAALPRNALVEIEMVAMRH